MKNEFIVIQEVNYIKKDEIYVYQKVDLNYIRIYLKSTANGSYWTFTYNTTEERDTDIKKLNDIFFNNGEYDIEISDIFLKFFDDIYTDIRNDGKLLGISDIVEKVNKSEKMKGYIQQIKELFYGKNN